MKVVRKRIFDGLFRKIIPVFICFSIILFPSCVFALNTDLVEDEIYWIDKGNEIYYSGNDYFEGFSKYIADEDEGCFYFFSRFTDYRIDRNTNENITLAFTIKNDVNTYSFQVDKNGLMNSSSKNTLESIDVYYNFDEASCKRQGGGVFVAFKLKNKTDRMLNNSISCEYYCGLNCTYNLLDSVHLDMYVPTTVKTTKAKTTKQTTSKKSQKTETKAKTNTTKAIKETSTKFSGLGNTSANKKTSAPATKFSGSGNQIADDEVTEEALQSEESNNANVEKRESSSEISAQNSSTELSYQAKLLIIIFTVVFVVGVICIIIGTVNSKKDKKEPDCNE